MDDNRLGFQPGPAAALPTPCSKANTCGKSTSGPKYLDASPFRLLGQRKKRHRQQRESRNLARAANWPPKNTTWRPIPRSTKSSTNSTKPSTTGSIGPVSPTSQTAYDEAVSQLFHALEFWESTLGKQPFLAGQAFSEADICFFTTLVHFNPVYFIHFKCSHRRVVQLNLWSYWPHLPDGWGSRNLQLSNTFATTTTKAIVISIPTASWRAFRRPT